MLRVGSTQVLTLSKGVESCLIPPRSCGYLGLFFTVERTSEWLVDIVGVAEDHFVGNCYVMSTYSM